MKQNSYNQEIQLKVQIHFMNKSKKNAKNKKEV